MANEPAYKNNYGAVSLSVLYRHNVSKFHDIRSGQPPKGPPSWLSLLCDAKDPAEAMLRMAI